MTSLAEAFGLGRGCFGREGVLRCTGTFPDSYRCEPGRRRGSRGCGWRRRGMQASDQLALELAGGGLQSGEHRFGDSLRKSSRQLGLH